MWTASKVGAVGLAALGAILGCLAPSLEECMHGELSLCCPPHAGTAGMTAVANDPTVSKPSEMSDTAEATASGGGEEAASTAISGTGSERASGEGGANERGGDGAAVGVAAGDDGRAGRMDDASAPTAGQPPRADSGGAGVAAER